MSWRFSRFTQEAARLGLRPGIAVDLEEMKPDVSERWDLDKEADQGLVEELIENEQPELLTGSPPCEAFSQLQHILKFKRDPEAQRERLEQGRQ